MLLPGRGVGEAAFLKFYAKQFHVRFGSPTRRTVPPGCARSGHRPAFLRHHAVDFLPAIVEGDGGARRAVDWGAEGSGSGAGRGCRKSAAIRRSAEAGPGEGVRGAGSRPQEADGRARSHSEGCAKQGGRGSECGERARGGRVCRGKTRDRNPYGTTCGGNPAPRTAGTPFPWYPHERGPMKQLRKAYYSLVVCSLGLDSAADCIPLR